MRALTFFFLLFSFQWASAYDFSYCHLNKKGAPTKESPELPIDQLTYDTIQKVESAHLFLPFYYTEILAGALQILDIYEKERINYEAVHCTPLGFEIDVTNSLQKLENAYIISIRYYSLRDAKSQVLIKPDNNGPSVYDSEQSDFRDVLEQLRQSTKKINPLWLE